MAEEVATPTEGQQPQAAEPQTPAPEGSGEPDYKALYEEVKGKFEDAVKTRDKAKEKARTIAEIQDEYERLKEENKTFKAAEAEKAKKKKEEEGRYQELIAENKSKYEDEKRGLLGELRVERVKNAIIAHAAEGGAINPDDIYRALNNGFDLDKETRQPVPNRDWLKEMGIDSIDDDTGSVKTVAQIVEEYLSTRSHLVKAKTPGGGGGTLRKDGKGAMTLDTFKSMTPDEQKEYLAQNPGEQDRLRREEMSTWRGVGG